MAGVLSQAEIDALLNAIETDGFEAQPLDGDRKSEAREYDFRTANRFSREQIRTLALVYENFSRMYST